MTGSTWHNAEQREEGRNRARIRKAKKKASKLHKGKKGRKARKNPEWIKKQNKAKNEKIPRDKQYLHPKWIRLREIILKRDKRTCQNCKRKDRPLHVHHKRYSGGYVWEVKHKWLITLCEICHSDVHKRDLTKNQTYYEINKDNPLDEELNRLQRSFMTQQ